MILTLTGGLAVALAGGDSRRVDTPAFVADRHLVEQLSEVGVILLMFGVGLHFHSKELLAVRRIAVPGAVFQSLLATALGAGTGCAFGWGWSAGLVYLSTHTGHQ